MGSRLMGLRDMHTAAHATPIASDTITHTNNIFNSHSPTFCVLQFETQVTDILVRVRDECNTQQKYFVRVLNGAGAQVLLHTLQLGTQLVELVAAQLNLHARFKLVNVRAGYAVQRPAEVR